MNWSGVAEAEPMDEISPREGGRGLSAVRNSGRLSNDPTEELDLSKLHSFAKGHFGVSTAQQRHRRRVLT